MSERIQIIIHKGHEILCVDNSNLKSAETVENFINMQRMAIAHKINLHYMDISNTTADEVIKKAGIDASTACRAALGELHCAVVGARGIQKILGNAMNKGVHYSDSKEEGLDWLVKQVS